MNFKDISGLKISILKLQDITESVKISCNIFADRLKKSLASTYMYFLHFGLKVLDKEFPQVMQRLQLASYRVFKAANVLSSLFTPVKLSCQLCQPTCLLGFIMFQTFIVFLEAIVSQLQLLVCTNMTQLT